MLADLVAVMPFVGIEARASYTGRYESTEDEQMAVFRSISA